MLLERQQPENAQVIKLRFFAGLSLEETAAALGMSRNCPSQMGLRQSLVIWAAERILS